MQKMQSRQASLVEAIGGMIFGFITSIVIGQFIYHAFGYPVTISDNIGMTVAFTAISFVRSYAVRRFFNHLHMKGYPR